MASWRDKWKRLPWWGKALALFATGAAGGAVVHHVLAKKPALGDGSEPVTPDTNADTTEAPSKNYMGGYTDELASLFRLSVPDYAPSWLVDSIVASSQKHDLSPFIPGAIVAWESDWSKGLTPSLSPTGTGDGGHGRGPWQLDDRPPAGNTAFIESASYADPDAQAEQAVAGHIMPAINQFGLDNLDAVFATYNAGPGAVKKAIAAGNPPGSVTTGTTHGTYVDAVNYELAQLTTAADGQADA